MTVLYLLLLGLAALCFVASALGRGRYDTRVNLVSLGLFFWVLVPLIQTARAIN